MCDSSEIAEEICVKVLNEKETKNRNTLMTVV